MYLLLALLVALGLLAPPVLSQEPFTIVVGDDPSPIGWIDGICYVPISEAIVGDKLEFNFDAHNVYKMASEEHFDDCDFSDAILLAEVGDGQLQYEITEPDALEGTIYFACQVGAHCQGNQKLLVNINREPDPLASRTPPTSRYIFGASQTACQDIQQGAEEDGFLNPNNLESSCTDPVLQEDGSYFRSCLSGPVTLTPGGVINEARLMHYPFPTDRRVKVDLRTWEFVMGDPDGADGLQPTPINQLYVHHLSGNVILGQGTEGIRRTTPDGPYPEPYGLVTGNEGSFMIFHIIDLREVDDWLPCIECRCKDGNGTYLDIGGINEFGVSITGGVDCCTNCTDLVTPTVDYRMRYNVSYFEITKDPVAELIMLTADISPAVGKNIEFDVPQFIDLPESQKSSRPNIQRLEREGPFKDIFKHEFFGDAYDGPEIIKLFRCVGHLHVAAVGMWLEDAETGEIICAGIGRYGTDPSQDDGFLNAVSVDSFETPKVFPETRIIRLVTEYDATEFHTGVMGMWFVFTSGEQNITDKEAALIVDFCQSPSCDPTLLPSLDDFVLEGDAENCEDTLAQNPICRFGNICDCEAFVNAPESTGCDGVYSSDFGDLPVNSVCASYCGCPKAPPTTTCDDVLSSHPLCRFANLCECEVLINSSESTGCDGVYTTDMGVVQVNEVCGATCDACPDTSAAELLEEVVVETIEQDLSDACHYATDKCYALLSNLFSCATYGETMPPEEPVVMVQQATIIDPDLLNIVQKHGRRLALEYSKLGNPSLHDDTDDERMIPDCSEQDVEVVDPEDPDPEDPSQDMMDSSGAFEVLLLYPLLAQILYTFLGYVL